jgi:hypothetical protein
MLHSSNRFWSPHETLDPHNPLEISDIHDNGIEALLPHLFFLAFPEMKVTHGVEIAGMIGREGLSLLGDHVQGK